MTILVFCIRNASKCDAHSAQHDRAGAAAVWGKLDKQVLENCMGIVAVALSLVMAGSGHLPTLQLLQGTQSCFTKGENIVD